MKRIALPALLAFAVATGRVHANEAKDLTRVAIPDDQAAATHILKDWLCARGYDCQLNKETLVFRRGLLINVLPIIFKGELDRLRVTVLYEPKDEFKASADLAHIVEKANRSQNFLQVCICDDGRLMLGSNVTFYDELTAREFDA